MFVPDSYKGSLPAADAARALAHGWGIVDANLRPVLMPMADGGEGTIAAIEAAVSGALRVPVQVTHPTNQGASSVGTSWLLLPADPDAERGTAVVELASTAGLELLGDKLDPWNASTYGFGQAIAAALDFGISKLVLAIGSSASTDGGVGMLAALGATVGGVDPHRVRGAASLGAITSIDISTMRPLPSGGATVITDVTSPLIGAAGAASLFGRQKGFEPAELLAVDELLATLPRMLAVDPASPGAGAAGGTGYAALAWGANLTRGADTVAEIIGLRSAIAQADFVVTGEGSYDNQSTLGKVPGFVLELARDLHRPAAIVAGRLAHDALGDGFSAAVSLTELAGNTDLAVDQPERWLRQAGASLASWASVNGGEHASRQR
ncbi:glycerate kinase [Microbacterium invictum]|uniref:Glycerate kinase n=1 Tax=Microbacterium invictum TaxID=515415 RepID=A0ABZ0VAQ0_9MICO|nr:glycerate kinase [Microbacterium invictum]WQB70706.1 glycerate kinase [Microbacterium invictum]